MFFGYKRFHIVTDMLGLLLAELLTVAGLSRIAHERYVTEIGIFCGGCSASSCVERDRPHRSSLKTDDSGLYRAASVAARIVHECRLCTIKSASEEFGGNDVGEVLGDFQTSSCCAVRRS